MLLYVANNLRVRRPMVCRDRLAVMNGAKAPITLPIQKQTTHTTATFYTTADYMVHYTSVATKSKLHNIVLQSYRGYESLAYQQPFKNSSPYGRDLAAQTTVY